jgi:hypothetical protein
MFASERSGPVRVGDVLIAALPELSDRLLEETLKAGWSQLIGAELGRRSRPGRIRAGVLEVTVDNSTWLQEMTLRSRELLARLRAHVPSVTALKVGLGALPPMAPPAPRVERPARRFPLSREELREIDETVATLPDPALAGSLRRLLTKDVLARRVKDPSRRPADSRRLEREDS